MYKPLLPIFNERTILVTRTFRPRLKFLVPLLLLLLAAWCIPSPARAFADAGNPNPGILPPQSTAFGRTYGALSAAWWQYVLGQPDSKNQPNTNPLLDTTGINCRLGQPGPVFFLVGVLNGGTATRDRCTVPAGKALFFPLLNAPDTHVPCPLPGCDTNLPPEMVWADLQNLFGPPHDLRGATSELHATIDGVPVHNLTPATTPYRACAGGPKSLGCAPAFNLTLPADNLAGLPADTYSPSVADGFYLLLAPLTPGPHTVTFGGTFLFGGSVNTQDITYHLMVLP
jgi:hypothetical protein